MQNNNTTPTNTQVFTTTIGEVVAVVINHELIGVRARDIEYIETTQDGENVFLPRVSNKMHSRLRLLAYTHEPIFLTMSGLYAYAHSREIDKKTKEVALGMYVNSI